MFYFYPLTIYFAVIYFHYNSIFIIFTAFTLFDLQNIFNLRFWKMFYFENEFSNPLNSIPFLLCFVSHLQQVM